MATSEKEPLIAVSYRIRPQVRAWLAAEAAQKHDRPANWLVNQLLEAAYRQAQQKPEGAQA